MKTASGRFDFGPKAEGDRTTELASESRERNGDTGLVESRGHGHPGVESPTENVPEHLAKTENPAARSPELTARLNEMKAEDAGERERADSEHASVMAFMDPIDSMAENATDTGDTARTQTA
ncbi:MAG TPA: hypothetical protein PK765_01395 [bacterium]|nr:hypothetical protein [bacterium]